MQFRSAILIVLVFVVSTWIPKQVASFPAGILDEDYYANTGPGRAFKIPRFVNYRSLALDDDEPYGSRQLWDRTIQKKHR